MKTILVTISYSDNDYEKTLQAILETIVSSNDFTEDMINYHINSEFCDNNAYEINKESILKIRKDLKSLMEDITNKL